MDKLVVCDLDGTLLSPDHRLAPYSRSVLEKLRQRNIALTLASGRHFQDIRALSAQLGGEGYLISSNGAAIHDPMGTLVQCTPLDTHCVTDLLTDPCFGQVHVNVYRAEDWLVSRPEPRLLAYHQDSGFRYQITDLQTLNPEGVLKIFFFGEPSHLRALETMILDRYRDRLSTTFSLPVTLEIMAKGVSKGAALRQVAERLTISLTDVIAFGDGMNDMEMLDLAGAGFLMDNADPRLKNALSHLRLIGSNRDQSVARFLDDLFLSGLGGVK